MPEETSRIGTLLLRENEPDRLIDDQLFEKWREEGFVDLDSSEGKPGDSPVLLAFGSVFQLLERLADRQAAQALWLSSPLYNGCYPLFHWFIKNAVTCTDIQDNFFMFGNSLAFRK
jgi:hypothetical protein